MKTFESDTCYAILQIAPDAGRDEIRHAYREALALYDAESLATYALFSEGERRLLLAAVETAFATLIDDAQRDAYDAKLIASGALDAARVACRSRQQRADRPAADTASRETSLKRWTSEQAAAPQMRARIDALLESPRLSGPDLKSLRDAYGIDLSEIYATTRINRDVMTAIEADRFDALPAVVYLKQFLRNLAEILQLDPDVVVARYLDAMGGSGNGR